ncbi:MAG: NADH:flavin oxidoreductase [Bacilli bacterium]|jgi:2,4-dienoyl-CoA reductase-like NADH-dependent reductase (Old Yellow Enzyme family)|nr:NADH:flavin oxidoreductase [Bacilli bacterium]MDD4584625.1 NADH:flavin oxidoreductase [Bacilli bacterium]
MKSVLKTIKINNLTLRNRLVFAPAATYMCDLTGNITDKTLEYYRDRTIDKSFGLVVIEHSYVNIKGRNRRVQLSVSKDSDIPSLKKLANVIHENDTPALVQINHCGAAMFVEEATKNDIAYSASAIHNDRFGKDSVSMSKNDIKEVIDSFAEAAYRVQESGFDGVEIHCCHGYLLNQFLSPKTNKRTDEYGGNLENRARLLMEVTKAVKKRVSKDFIISVRIVGTDIVEGGIGAEEVAKIIPNLCKLGIHMLSVSGGLGGYVIPGKENVEGYFAPFAEIIKRASSVPVVLTGGFKTLENCSSFIDNNVADLIGVARAVIANPHWAAKEIDKLK